MDSLPSPPADSTIQEVSWQTCFFLLLTLSLNTMTQPCGATLGIKKPHRIYLRCSPTALLYDFFDSIYHVYVHWREGASLTRSFRIFLALKFRYTDDLGYGEALKNSYRNMWTRWLLFVLSALPSTIKLAGLRGSSWEQNSGIYLTQAFGFIFVFSWLETELLIWLAYRDLTKFPQSMYTEPPQIREMGSYSSAYIVTGVNYYILFYYSLIWIIILFQDQFFPVMVCLAGLAMMVLIFFGDILIRITSVVVMKRALKSRPALVENLLVGYIDKSGNAQIDEKGLMFLGRFFTILIFTVLEYRFLYEPKGTINPGWTSVFG